MLRRRIAFSLAAAAVSAAALVVVRGHRDPWKHLVSAAARSQDVAALGRLSDFAASPRRFVFRGAATSGGHSDMTLQAAAFAVLESDDDQHRKAVALFLVGRRDEAENQLVHLTRSGAQAATWNDLAVVRAAKTPAQDDTLIAALAAADRAVDLDPGLAAARFNRALILERIGLKTHAVRAYREYIRIDSTSEWASQARQRIRELDVHPVRTFAWRTFTESGDLQRLAAEAAQLPQDARLAVEREILPEWGQAVLRGDLATSRHHLALARTIGESLLQTSGESMAADAVNAIDRADGNAQRTATLAAGYVRFGQAIALNQARQITTAAPRFEEAERLLGRESSPFALIARQYLIGMAAERGERAAALSLLHELMAATPEGYRSFHALMHRLRGNIMGLDAVFGEALRSFETAYAAYVRIGETQAAAEVSSRMAGVLTLLGRRNEAWPRFNEAFQTAGSAASPRALQMVLHSATFVALEERRWDIAHALLNLEVELGPAAPTLYADALVWRVLAAQRAEMERSALLNMAAARAAAGSITDERLRTSIQNELRFVEAILLERDSPARADAIFSEVLAVAEKRDLTRVPHVLTMRAAVRRRLHRQNEAEQDLRAAIELLEKRRESIGRDVFRDAFLGKSSEAWLALSELLDDRGDVEEAVETADLPRARIIIDRAGGDRAPARGFVRIVAADLQPDQALVAWTVYRDRTTIAVIRSGGLRRFVSTTRAEDVQQLAERFNAAVHDGDNVEALRSGRRLYDVLFAPAAAALDGATDLIAVCDTPLDRVPFAAVVQANGRFLIEDFTITIAAGIRAYASAASRPQRDRTTLLSVGNPRVDQARYSSLPPLPAAGREAEDVAAMYPEAVVLRDSDATEERVLSLMRRSTIVDLATHAISDPSDPLKSRVLLAGDGHGDGALTTAEIASLDLRNLDVVVLAGCRTAMSGRTYGYLQSLASSFLAARAHHVVGSLWDLEDTTGRELSIALHRGLRRGLDPAAALREAQLAMLRSRRERGATRSWAGMRLMSVR